jgi:hypothetical protein
LEFDVNRDRLLALELDFEREIYSSKSLSLFRRNPSTWELLVFLAQFEDGSDEGVYSTLDRLRTRYLGNSAMLKFVRDRRDDGSLIFSEHTKRSKWKIQLRDEIREALIAALHERAAKQQEISASPAGPSRLIFGIMD